MILLSKIVHFEMGHALTNYPGSCSNLHGHSYELHVTVSSNREPSKNFLPFPGFEVDFKELKSLVNKSILDQLDHRTVLSSRFLATNPALGQLDNLVVWEVEPTAENLLIFIRNNLQQVLPTYVQLKKLVLYETKDSYAEWLPDSE